MNKEIKIYGSIGSYGLTASDLTNTIQESVSDGANSLTFRVHSEGGSVIDGNAIFNTIRQLQIPTKVIIDGMAASMASIIILAVDEVEICENAFIMIHRPSVTYSGDYETIRESMDMLKSIENVFLKCYAQKTGLSEKEVKSKWFDGKDHWLNADQAVQLGLADRKVSAIAQGVNIGASLKDVKSIYTKFSAKLNMSNNKNNIIMKEEIIKRFNLKDVDTNSTDIEVLNKLEEYVNSLKNAKEKGEEKAVETVVESAIRSGKILASAKDTYMNIGKSSGIANLNAVFDSIPTANNPVIHSLASYIKPEAKFTLDSKDNDIRHNVSKWGLDEYRKYNPKALQDNPKLYEELYNKEYNNK